MLRLKTQCREKQAWLAAEPPAGEGPACGRRGRGCCSALLTHRPLPAGTNPSLLRQGWTQRCMGNICHLKAPFWDIAMEQCLPRTGDSLPCPTSHIQNAPHWSMRPGQPVPDLASQEAFALCFALLRWLCPMQNYL